MAKVELDTQDIEVIRNTTSSIIRQLAEQPEIADSDVPKTLKSLNALLSDPKSSSKRAAFAVLRTVENLVAKVFNYGADLIDKTASKTVDGLSSTLSKTIIAGLISLALSATIGLGDLATGKITETAWMKTAAEIVKKQLEDYLK